MPQRNKSCKFNVPQAMKMFRILIVDVRGGAKLQRELVGAMVCPTVLVKDGIRVNFRFDELRGPLVGATFDVCPEGCNLVFALMAPIDGMDKRGRSLSVDEISGLFRKYHSLKEVGK